MIIICDIGVFAFEHFTENGKQLVALGERGGGAEGYRNIVIAATAEYGNKTHLVVNAVLYI